MTDEEVYSPTHSFGVDSSRVLDEIMDADSRTQKARDLLSQMSATIGNHHYEAARGLLPRIVEVLGEAAPEVARIQTLLGFLGGHRMRSIHKGAEPPTLAQHRQMPHCDYDNFQDKDILRRALVTEQRELCCYCMGRIRAAGNAMKIEHWLCQAYHSTEQLNYKNLLGACLGGEGQPGNKQHCDTRKGNKALIWNPADPSHHIESRVRYELNGSIHGDGATFDDQLNDVLNLNLPQLKEGTQEPPCCRSRVVETRESSTQGTRATRPLHSPARSIR